MSFFEVGMLSCFGCAWPLNIIKSFKSKTAKGKSIQFQYAVLLGYVFGITHKILYNNDIVLYLYILNFLMVAIDTVLWYRNRALDKLRDESEKQREH